jgi:hypothetical protein
MAHNVFAEQDFIQYQEFAASAVLTLNILEDNVFVILDIMEMV